MNYLNQISSLAKGFFNGDSRSVAVKKNMLLSIVIRCVSIFVSLMLVPLTIGYVSAELYGVWLTISSMLTWLTFTDLGFSQGLKNKLAESIALEDWERGRQLVSTTYFLMLLIIIPVCGVLSFIIPHINWCSFLNVDSQFEHEIKVSMMAMLAMFGFQMVVNVFVSVVAAFQKVALSTSFNVMGSAIGLLIVYILTKTTQPSLLYLCLTLGGMPPLVLLVASLFFYSSSFKKVAPSIKDINLSLTSDLFSLGYKFFFINIQVLIIYYSTNLLISYVSSPLMVTSYNIAYRYLNIAMMIFTIITAPLWPAYTDAITKGDYDWMNRTKRKMEKVLLISVSISVLMVIVSPIAYKYWINGKAEVPFLMTILVSAYTSAYNWTILNTTILAGMSKLKVSLLVGLIGCFIHIPLSILLGRVVGGYAVVISMLVINTIYAVVYHIQVNLLLQKKARGIWNQ